MKKVWLFIMAFGFISLIGCEAYLRIGKVEKKATDETLRKEIENIRVVSSERTDKEVHYSIWLAGGTETDKILKGLPIDTPKLKLELKIRKLRRIDTLREQLNLP